MYFALVAFSCLLLGYVWRRARQHQAVEEWLLSHRPRRISPGTWMHASHYYSLIHLALLGLFAWDLVRFWRLLGRAPRLPPNLPEAEVQDLALPYWLRRLALCSPGFVFLTLLLSGMHTAWQVRRGLTQQRDRAVQVILLPSVYGIFALDSVLCALTVMWGAVASKDREVVLAWREHVRLRDEIYASNFEVADLYEAWALWCFGKVCVRYVQLNLGDGSASRELFRPLKRITLLGIQAFVFVYTMKSLYLLSLSALRSYPFELQVCGWGANGEVRDEQRDQQQAGGRVSFACGWERFFSGAGFTASSIAIYNIFTFEHNLEPFLQGFKPRWKFLGVKLLVSLAFIQDLVLQVLSALFLGLSSEQRQLLYASLICAEVLAIGCLHVPAWNAHDAWYDEDREPFSSESLEATFEEVQANGSRTAEDFRSWEARRYPAAADTLGRAQTPSPQRGRCSSRELELRQTLTAPTADHAGLLGTRAE